MKKLLLFCLLLNFILLVPGFAETDDRSPSPPENLVDIPFSKTGRMVDLAGSTQADIRSLERRIGDMDRELRYLSDRLRDVERSVDDLRRRRPNTSNSAF